MPANQPPVEAIQGEARARAKRALVKAGGHPESYARHLRDSDQFPLAEIIPAMLAFQSEARAVPPDGERVESIALDVAETIAAHMRSPDMIWGLGGIDPELLGEMEAELRSVTVAALTNALSSLSLPHQADREAIARIIDPEEWALDDLAKAKGFRSMFINESLTKADAILTLSPTPSAGRDGGGECIMCCVNQITHDCPGRKK